MPAALQVINAWDQNITGGAFEDLEPGTGDSFTVFNVPQESLAQLACVWGVDDASPAEISIKASRFHDQQFGIRARIPDGDLTAPVDRPVALFPLGFDQRLYPSDVLDIEVNGTAADNVNVTLLIYYPNLPGIAGRFASPDYVENVKRNIVGINVAPTSGAGDWGASRAINADDARMHANTDYALLGWTASLPRAAVGISGTDVGNFRVGGPALADGESDTYYFANLSRHYGVPLIPVINSNNAGNTLIQLAHTAAVATPIDLIFAELSQPFSG